MNWEEKADEKLFREEAIGPQKPWKDHFTAKLPLNPLDPLPSNPRDWFWMNGVGNVWLDLMDRQVGFQEMHQTAVLIPLRRIIRRSEKNLFLLKTKVDGLGRWMDGRIRILKKPDPTGQRMDGRIRFLKKSEPTVQRMGKEHSLIC